MKKFLFVLAALICFALPKAEAQNGFIDSSMTKVEVIEPEPEAPPVKKVEVDKGVRHFAELEIGLPIIKTGYWYDCSATAIGANYEIGYKFNKTIFLGAGLGIGYLDTDSFWEHEFGETCENCGDNEYDGVYAKLFINSKIYFTKTKVQPYLDLSVGGIYFKQGHSWSNSDDCDINKKVGVVLNPQIGVNFKLKNKGAIFATVGGNIMPDYSPEGYFTLKIGYAF